MAGMDDLIGQSIRGYELHELVGEGGFGAVYRATQTVVGREVVIKIILPHFANQPEFIRRFEAEAQLVARLEHPHIVPLYDYWRDPTGAYLVMRYLRGGTLRNALEKGPYSVRNTVRLLGQMAAALTIAHRNGVIHRDVKPSNILLDDDRNSYLTDFGIATTQIEGNTKGNSQSGRVSGSAGYISPEQINMQPISGRTDMYAMGIILYEMLMGHHPFAGAKSAVALFIKHANEPLPAMEGIPQAIQDVIFKAAAKNPEDRYADMMELANAFRQAAQNSDFIGLKSDDPQMEEFDSSFELTPSTSTVSAANPYKGLRAFQESDAGDFFGRETLTKLLLTRLDDDHELYRFLAVVGPSGSGKSSVVKAGVIPALRRGEIHNSENWFIVEMVPGISPFKELAQALASIATTALPDIMEFVKEPKNGGLNAILKKVLPLRNSELLLMIDQFEEVFTQCEEYERNLFLEAIQEAVTAQDSRLRVIVTLRADFYDRPLMVQNFSQLMQQRTEVVIPLTVDELERAITGPARQVKVFFQQGLAATIVSEVNEQPGVLPMLQYALTELFERRDGSLLTTKAYQEIGGVLGALARRAEDLYKQLDAEKQEITRQLFLRLVTLGEGTEDTRRRALQSELFAAAPDPRMMQQVIDLFGSYRLLTYDRDPITRTPTVEVAHEALIREWQRLREWLDSSRSDIRLQRMLASAAKDWEEANHEPSFLLRGGRLVQFEDWIGTSTIAISQKERDFLDASIAERKRAEEEEALRLERERLAEKRARQRTRAIAIILAVATVMGGILSVFALQQRSEAVRAASDAIAARETAVLAQNDALNQAATATIAQGEALNQAATATIAQGEAINQAATATVAQGEAINQAATATIAQGEAINQAATATNAQGEAINQAATATNALGEAQSEANANATAQAVAIAAANIAATAQANSLRDAQVSQSLALAAYANQLINTNSALALALALEANDIPNPSLQAQTVLLSVVYIAPRSFQNNQLPINALLFHPDGASYFTANSDGSVHQWSVEERRIVKTFAGAHTRTINALDISANGQVLATASDDTTVVLWNVESGEPLQTLVGHNGSVNGVSFSPNGSQVASGSDDASVIIWNTRDGSVSRRLTSESRNAVNAVDWAPNGQNLLVIADDAMRLWNFGSASFLEFNNSPSRVRDGEFSPDSSQLVISGNVQSSTPQLWDVQRRNLIREYPAHTAPVNSVHFSPDGSTVLSASDDFVLILSDRTTGDESLRFAAHNNRVTDAAFSPDGLYIFSASSAGEIFQWDVGQTSEKREFTRASRNVVSLSRTMFSPQGKYVITAMDDGSIIVWEEATGTIVRTINMPMPQPLIPQTRLVLSPLATDDNLLAAWGSTDIRIVNLSTGETLRQITTDLPRVFVESLAFSPDGRYVVWAGGQFFRENLPEFSRAGILAVYDVETGELVRSFAGHNLLDEEGNIVEGVNRAVTAAAISVDGSFLISGAEDGTIYQWEIATGNLLREFTGHADRVTQIQFDKSGTRMLTSSADRAAILWDFNSTQLFRRFTGHNGAVNSVAFNSTDTAILTGSTDSRMIIWDVETGQSRQQFIGSDSPIVSVEFSSDDDAVLAGSLDGRTTEWKVDSAEQLRAWAQVNRYIPEFTCTQRLQFGLPLCDAAGNPPTPISDGQIGG
jgi:WD40 repeat protein/serine/threonine protein kinase